MKKIKFSNKVVTRKFFNFFCALLSIISTVFVFFEFNSQIKLFIFLGTIVILFICYIVIWVYERTSKRTTINIKGSPIEIMFGDIFDQKDLKVITFNEYFDTIVDDVIIAKKSINGQFLLSNSDNVDKINDYIDNTLKDRGCDNVSRNCGKSKKYELGTSLIFKDYILTAFSKFDDNNRAHLTIKEFQNFLLDFWNEIDKIYSGRTIVVPLFGAKIVRFNDIEYITEQELLELLIVSFKVSRIKFRHPSRVKIVLSEDIIDKIDLTRIKLSYK